MKSKRKKKQIDVLFVVVCVLWLALTVLLNLALEITQKCRSVIIAWRNWIRGKMPICVRSCTTRALDAGFIDEMIFKYGDDKKAEGFKLLRKESTFNYL